MNMTINPLISIEYLVLIIIGTASLCAYLSWSSSSLLPKKKRIIITALRIAFAIALFIPIFNFGFFKNIDSNEKSVWAILTDTSKSMGVMDANGQKRIAAANNISKKIEQITKQCTVFPFDTQLHSPCPISKLDEHLDAFTPNGNNTDISGSVAELIKKYSDSPQKLRGIIILSDGRDVLNSSPEMHNLANAYNIPVFGICLGSKVKRKDMKIRISHSFYTVFKGQKIIITPELVNSNMGKISLVVEILDDRKKIIASKKINSEPDSVSKIKFQIPAENPGLHSYKIRIKSTENIDSNPENDSTSFSMNVITSKLKILLVEGRPFWDTKFLARLYTDNAAINLTSIYRFTNQRFFKVSENEKTTSSDTVIFPNSIENLAQYNLIVFGKGIEFFLDDKKIALLKKFVRDYGGTIIFSRGKPYSGQWKSLHSLEPVEWGGKLSGSFKWQPTDDGTDTGLFGEMLPNAKSNIWNELPPIQSAYQCPEANSFSQILVKAIDQDNTKTTIPVLISRRFGKGIVLAVNSQNLWQWDFFPLNGETADFYKNFWTQLVFWTISYSDFLPNKNYSLKLSKTNIQPNEKINIKISSKTTSPYQPKIQISKNNKILKEIIPAKIQPRSWNAVCSFTSPGIYKATLLNENNHADIFVPFKISSPPCEKTNLSSAPEKFSDMLTNAGGKLLEENELKNLLTNNKNSDLTMKKNEKWVSTWDKWYILIVILLFIATECRIRRINGLL